ncbi:hypothetical protein [Sphaerothrix gracilis]|uniref:hypothetical protein n=1 Tax=Sphaerothrix gracilis TaxID=3151835 RepID=UPI0031FD4645
MNNTDMELRAIREKLQSLQREPLSSEATALPWNGRSEAYWPKAAAERSPVALPRSSPAQIHTTVETLRQRSGHTAISPQPETGVVSPPSQVAMLLEQYQQQLQQQAQQINQLAIAQEEAILKLKSLSDRWTSDLKQQAARSGEELASVVPLCQFEAALVPAVQPDAQGNLRVTYRNLDLLQETHDAYDLADSLRHRGGAPRPRQSETYTGLDLGMGAILAEPLEAVQSLGNWLRVRLHQWRRSLRRRQRQQQRQPSPLTFLDAVIWFSGAAMVRVGIDVLSVVVPWLQIPLLVLLLGLGAWSVYRALLSPQPDYALGYRLLIAIMGLIAGGHL